MKRLLKKIYRFFFPILNKGQGNSWRISSKMRGQTMISFYGNNNKVIIGENCLLNDVEFFVCGNNNILEICDNVRIKKNSSLWLEGNSCLKIGTNTGIGSIKIRIKDGNIVVGDNCMFSAGILLRNWDGHRVYNLGEELQTNIPGNIIIGNHVWICENASIIKKCEIGNDSIIAYGSVVTKGCLANCVLAGNPAKVVKENISWDY